MKNTLLVAGFSSLVVAVILYTLGYTNLDYVASSTQVLIYPAAFFGLLGLVLLFWAVRYARKTIAS